MKRLIKKVENKIAAKDTKKTTSSSGSSGGDGSKKGPPVDVFHAAQRGDVDTLKYWMDKKTVTPNTAGPWRRTPLMWASLIGSVPAVKYLLKVGGDPDVQGRTSQTRGLSFVFFSCVIFNDRAKKNKIKKYAFLYDATLL